MTERQIELARELRWNKCRCTAYKSTGNTFCRRCYLLLPPDMKQGLYRRLSEGYEEAYALACRALDFIGDAV